MTYLTAATWWDWMIMEDTPPAFIHEEQLPEGILYHEPRIED